MALLCDVFIFLLIFLVPNVCGFSPQKNQEDLIGNDPSFVSGAIAIPLALHAKKLQDQRALPTEPSTSKPQFLSNDQMSATVAQTHVETLFPSTAMETKQTPMVLVWSRKFKSPRNQTPLPSVPSLFPSQQQSTTPLNDLPLLLSPNPATTPTLPPSTLNDLPPSFTSPKSSSTLPTTPFTPSFLTTSEATKFSFKSGKHHRHGNKKSSIDRPMDKEPKNDADDEEERKTTISDANTTLPYEQRERCVMKGQKEFINSATTCKNERSEKICGLLFEDPDPKTGKRDPKCNVKGMEDIANSCRRQCGICCEHIDFACEDDSNHIIDCNKQLNKCQMTKWFDVLARFCAGSCGLCTRTACRDFDPKCREMKHLCLESSNIDFMRANCSRTCGFCVVGPGGISEDPLKRPPSIPACIDHAANCTENEALCSSPMHAEFMIKYCAKTCFKCTGDASQVIVPIVGTSPELNGTAAVLVPASVIMGAARPDNKECVDHHPKCAIWVAKGFCTHTKYTKEQRLALCPKSCGLC